MYNQSIKYGEFLRSREEKRIEKNKKQEEFIQSIVVLNNQCKTNIEICNELNLSAQKLQYWKRKARSKGIELLINKSKGRPKQIKLCPHCNGVL